MEMENGIVSATQRRIIRETNDDCDRAYHLINTDTILIFIASVIRFDTIVFFSRLGWYNLLKQWCEV